MGKTHEKMFHWKEYTDERHTREKMLDIISHWGNTI